MARSEKDVIVSAFASSANRVRLSNGETVNLSTFSQPLGDFLEEPAVVQVPFELRAGEGHYDKAFARAAEKYRDSTGSILRGLLAAHLSNIKVRRVCVVAFSAGGTFASKVIAGPDADWLDSVILLDALHLQKSWEGAPSFITTSIGPWANYGVRAGRAKELGDGPMLVMAHTQIATPHPLVGSTSQSAREVSSQVVANTPNAVRWGYNPDMLLGGPPPPAVTLGPGNGLPPPAVTFEGIPEPTGVMRGNYAALDFGGKTGAAHAFIPWFVQPGLWRAFLIPRWNAGLACEPPPLAGLGQDGVCCPTAAPGAATACGPQGVVVPEGMYEVPEGPNWPHALAGLVLGGAAGWFAGRAV